METLKEALDKMELPLYRNCVPDRNRCPYCKNAGYEIVYEYHPEVYGPNGSPIEYTIPCRKCSGKRPNYDRENRHRLKLPYDAFLSAFNPLMYRNEKNEQIDFQREFKIVRSFVDKFPKIQEKQKIKGLYLYSAHGGTGKTYLASIVCNEIYSRYQLMPLYITENNLLNELEKRVADSSDRPRDIIKKARVLFIDDLWRRQSQREWVNDELFSIIDYRYTEGLCTIVTSNMPLTDRRVDGRIASRLNEMCASIHMPEVDIRYHNKLESKKEFTEIIKESESMESLEKFLEEEK